jgi:hypothetical protein
MMAQRSQNTLFKMISTDVLAIVASAAVARRRASQHETIDHRMAAPAIATFGQAA